MRDQMARRANNGRWSVSEDLIITFKKPPVQEAYQLLTGQTPSHIFDLANTGVALTFKANWTSVVPATSLSSTL
jgi:hypothetical protein